MKKRSLVFLVFMAAMLSVSLQVPSAVADTPEERVAAYHQAILDGDIDAARSMLGEDLILYEDGVPEKSIVWLSHNDEVTKLPEDFEILASSENCKVQAMKHKSKPLFGLQFHPEVEHTEFGETIFKNFVKICEK